MSEKQPLPQALHERIDQTAHRVEDHIDRVGATLQAGVDRTQSAAHEGIKQGATLADRGQRFIEHGRVKCHHAHDRLRHQAHEHPVKALALAVSLGALLGYLASVGHRRRLSLLDD